MQHTEVEVARCAQTEPQALEDWGGSFDFYQDPRFLEVFVRHMGVEILERGGLIALASRRRWLGTLRVFVGGPESAKAAPRWMDSLVDGDYGYLEVRTNLPIPEYEAFCTCADDNWSIVVDLAVGPDALLASFKKRCRASVRMGIRRGIEIRLAECEGDFRKFHEIVWGTSSQGRLFPVPPIALLRDLAACGHGILHLAVVGGQIVGGNFSILSRSMIALVSGFDRAYGDSNVMYYEAMRWGALNGFRYFDMGDQSLAANPTLTQFKRGFRPKLAPARQYVLPGRVWKRWLLDLRKRRRGRGR